MEDLKTHIEAAQKKVKYFCAQCQYIVVRKEIYNVNIKLQHWEV